MKLKSTVKLLINFNISLAAAHGAIIVHQIAICHHVEEWMIVTTVQEIWIVTIEMNVHEMIVVIMKNHREAVAAVAVAEIGDQRRTIQETRSEMTGEYFIHSPLNLKKKKIQILCISDFV